jgi:hypothetical protein
LQRRDTPQSRPFSRVEREKVAEGRMRPDEGLPEEPRSLRGRKAYSTPEASQRVAGVSFRERETTTGKTTRRFDPGRGRSQ